MEFYVSNKTVCPFYRFESRKSVYCEGFAPSCGLCVAFADPERMALHKKSYCDSLGDYSACPLYSAINRQYE